MLSINNFTVVFIFQRFIAVLKLNLPFNFTYKLILNRLFTKNIIRSHTCLSTVKIFSKHNSLCRKFNIGICFHDTRTLATEFQNYRSERFRLMHKHFSANIPASRKKHKIKLLVNQSSIFFSSACNNSHIFTWENFRNNFLNNYACFC